MIGKYDIFHIENNNLSPHAGDMLISEPFLNDKYFGRSVILLVESDSVNGTMGFVVNKKTQHQMSDFFPDYEKFPPIFIFQGGPMEANKLFFIHTLGLSIPNSKKINDQIFFDGDFKVLTEYIKKGNQIEGKIKFFLGYSGWEKNQLSDELFHNSWIVSKYKRQRVMEENGELCWKNALSDMGPKYKSWINYPRLPYLN